MPLIKCQRAAARGCDGQATGRCDGRQRHRRPSCRPSRILGNDLYPSVKKEALRCL
jgi:hypothetical protein